MAAASRFWWGCDRISIASADLYQAVDNYDRARGLYQWMLQLKRQEAVPNQADIVALLISPGDLPDFKIFEGVSWLNELETDFVQQSLHKRANNMRRLMGIVVALTIMLTVLTTFALDQLLNSSIDIVSSAISPDGLWLATGGGEGLARLWMMDVAALKETACLHANRNFTEFEWEKYFPKEEYRQTCADFPIHPSIVGATP